MPNYDVSRMKRQQVDMAYVLVQAATPALSLADWRNFCQVVETGPEIGEDDIFVATNSLGYIHGVCVAGFRRHLHYKFTLDISLFVVASAADERGIAHDLVEYLLTYAGTTCCGAVRFWEDGTVQWRDYARPGRISVGPAGATLLLQPFDVSR